MDNISEPLGRGGIIETLRAWTVEPVGIGLNFDFTIELAAWTLGD